MRFKWDVWCESCTSPRVRTTGSGPYGLVLFPAFQVEVENRVAEKQRHQQQEACMDLPTPGKAKHRHRDWEVRERPHGGAEQSWMSRWRPNRHFQMSATQLLEMMKHLSPLCWSRVLSQVTCSKRDLPEMRKWLKMVTQKEWLREGLNVSIKERETGWKGWRTLLLSSNKPGLSGL